MKHLTLEETMHPADSKTSEKRFYDDNNDWLYVMWETANVITPGRVLIYDKEEHSEVDITYVLANTHA